MRLFCGNICLRSCFQKPVVILSTFMTTFRLIISESHIRNHVKNRRWRWRLLVKMKGKNMFSNKMLRPWEWNWSPLFKWFFDRYWQHQRGKFAKFIAPLRQFSLITSERFFDEFFLLSVVKLIFHFLWVEGMLRQRSESLQGKQIVIFIRLVCLMYICSAALLWLQNSKPLRDK